MTWKHTRSGRAFALEMPVAADVDVELDIAIPLSLLKRFDGHAGSPRLGYSVAQHSVMGADALLAETGSTGAALAFLLHDAHEAYCGDFATPVVVALDRIAAEGASGRTRRLVGNAVAIMKGRLDRAIHSRLGLPFPPPRETLDLVKAMDVRMLRAERDNLLPPSPLPWHDVVETAAPIPSIERILCWPAEDAAREWLDRLTRWHPEGKW